MVIGSQREAILRGIACLASYIALAWSQSKFLSFCFYFAKTKSNSKEVANVTEIVGKEGISHLLNVFQIFIWNLTSQKDQKIKSLWFCISQFSEKKCIDWIPFLTFKWQSFQMKNLSYHEYEIQMRLNVCDVYDF